MFENVAAADLLGVVRGHDFDRDDDVMGAARIDAIKACDLVIRAAQAAQAAQIAALNDLRASQITLGRGDHPLSVIGELGMARTPPSTACREVPPLPPRPRAATTGSPSAWPGCPRWQRSSQQATSPNKPPASWSANPPDWTWTKPPAWTQSSRPGSRA